MASPSDFLIGDSEHEDGDPEAEEEAAQLVDFRGNPITPQRQLGGWKAAILILGAFSASNVAFAGIFLNLVRYFTLIWSRTNAAAANDVTTVNGTMFCCAVLGAFLSDAYLGRFWGSVIFLTVYLLGCSAFSAFVSIAATTSWQWVCLNLSLYVAAIGYGAFEPALSALGGDQLDKGDQEKGVFFNLFFVVSNVGQGVALVVLSRLEYAGMWALSFWVATGCAAAALMFCLSGTARFRQLKPGGNPLVRVAQVLVAAVRKTRVSLPAAAAGETDEASFLYHDDNDQKPSNRSQLAYTNRFRWLDKAMIIDGGAKSKWRVCRVEEVEEVKCIASILPIWVTGVIYNMTVAQLSTLFVEQGEVMREPRWPRIPSASMQVFNIGSNVVFGMLYDVVVTRLGKRNCGFSKLQRMGIGLLVALAAMVVAGSVEHIRLLKLAQAADLSIFWLVPQYVLVGISQVLMVVAQMEFFYTEVSPAMRSLGSCLPLLARAFGNYSSTIVVEIVTSITTRNGNRGWISQDLNQGHLDYFYWLVATLMALDFIVFLGFSHSYTYLNTHHEIESSND